MAGKPASISLIISGVIILLGVYWGNAWISREIEEAGQIPPTAVSTVSKTATQAKHVRTGGQNLVSFGSRTDSNGEGNSPNVATKQMKTKKKRIIYEKPLDTKELVQ